MVINVWNNNYSYCVHFEYYIITTIFNIFGQAILNGPYIDFAILNIGTLLSIQVQQQLHHQAQTQQPRKKLMTVEKIMRGHIYICIYIAIGAVVGLIIIIMIIVFVKD